LGSYITDANGAAPRFISANDADLILSSPDGQSILVQQHGAWSLQPIAGGKAKPAVGIPPTERPIAWTSDPTHIFTQSDNAIGYTIYRVDITSGKREVWQELRPKDQIGFKGSSSPTTMTPDGKWMAFTYANLLGELYRSDTLK
jgi:Tol biopolymer transport system component